MAERLRHWTRDLTVWGSIPETPVRCKSPGQALNPNFPWSLRSNGNLVYRSKVGSTVAAAFRAILVGGKVKSDEYCIDIDMKQIPLPLHFIVNRNILTNYIKGTYFVGGYSTKRVHEDVLLDNIQAGYGRPTLQEPQFKVIFLKKNTEGLCAWGAGKERGRERERHRAREKPRMRERELEI